MRHHELGPRVLDDGRVRFRVWAPRARRVDLHIVAPFDKTVPMEARDLGYHEAVVEGVEPGTRYLYRLDDRLERPDPASRYQPEGVHGPSEVVEASFAWTDDTWFGLPLRDYVLYELHVGTFTPEGTFEAIIPHLDDLAEVGVTVLELMPVAQFPGERNWGYDGVYPYAVQDSYGGPQGLKRLVDACHARGLGVCLDVVYNHLGPEGCYLDDFGPYFTDVYATPWGRAINFDQADSDEVREFFIGNALHWFEEFHVDALRLDAVHTIHDTSALPFLEELAVATSELSDRLNRRLHLIAESADNDARIIGPRELGGYGLDAQWNDDFHHALYALVAGEDAGYYTDYGTIRHLERALRDGFVYQGEYSRHRRRRHGRSSKRRGAERFVVFTRNHDQIGNRMMGDRLAVRLSLPELKLVAGVLLLSPYIPLLFMGEEYGETAPFGYFVSHSDPDLVAAVREGRRREFESFGWEGEPPDPQAEDTFLRSKIDRGLATKGHHAILRSFYAELLRLRREIPALGRISKDDMSVWCDEHARVLVVRRWSGTDEVVVLYNLSDDVQSVAFPVPRGDWDRLVDGAAERWGGPGEDSPERIHAEEETRVPVSPHGFVAYHLTGRDPGEMG